MEKLGDAEKAKGDMAREISERRDQWAELKGKADASRLALEDLGQMARFGEDAVQEFNGARMGLLLHIDPL